MSQMLEKQTARNVTKDEKVDVTYIYNGNPVKVKGFNIFKRIKSSANVQIETNSNN